MHLTTTSLALLALPAVSLAVKLEDFVPRVTDVSSGCRKVYQQELPGCTPDDFTKQSCSASCVRGLVSMTQPVKDACGNDGLLDKGGDSNILVLFLTDKGPENLCTNAQQVLDAPSSSPSATPTPTPSSTLEKSTVAETTTAASSGDVPTSILMDTSSSSGATSASSDSQASVTGTSQIFEAPSMPPSFSSTAPGSQQTDSTGHSGGGSPFDAEGNEFSSASATSSSAFFFAAAVGFAILAAQR